MEARTVLVACASDWASPARFARVLADAGARVVAMSAPKRPLAVTRFVDRVIAAPVELAAYVEQLRAHLRETRYAWIVIADDPLLAALRPHRDEPWMQGVLPIAGPWSDLVASKAAFCARAAAADFPIARSRVCASFDDARRALDELGAPIILKQSSQFAGLGVRLIRDRADLAAAWVELATIPGEPIVIQQFVEGPIGNTVFLMDHGRPICWMSAFKARTYAGPFGPSSARRFMDHRDVIALLQRLGELTGYHGFGALDWVLGADDQLHVIELNTRPVPAIHMGRLAGVDFSRAVRGLLAGAPIAQPPPPVAHDAPIHAMFPEDIWRVATERKLELRGLWGRRRGASDVPWDDPRLLVHHLVSLSRSALRALPGR